MSIHHRRALVASLLVAGVACGGAAKPQTQPELAEHSLSGLAAQRIVLLPTYSIRVMPGLSWSDRPSHRYSANPRCRFARRTRRTRPAEKVDLPDDLQASFKRNASYAADPNGLAEEPAPIAAPQHRAAVGGAARVAAADTGRAARGRSPDLAPVEVRFRADGDRWPRGVAAGARRSTPVASDVDWRRSSAIQRPHSAP
jgi:hypothetical protein